MEYRLLLALGKEYPYPTLMIHSRVTSKSQVTVPRSVRAALGVAPGDRLQWQLEGKRVVVTRAASVADPLDPFATFTEWSDVLDSAYDDL